MSIARQIEQRYGAAQRYRGRRLALGACGPGTVTVNAHYGSPRAGSRPMGLGRRGALGQGNTGNVGHHDGYNCQTYPDPRVPNGNCQPGGWNGCGDTVAIPAINVAANTQVTIQVQAAIVFTPRFFSYTGPAATFNIDNVRVANGPDSNFGGGYSADIYAPASFDSKAVSWPTFYNAPPLLLVVTNTTGAAANFSGVLRGVAAHV